MYKIEGPEDGGVAPKGPNFFLIVILFSVGIVVILGAALLFIPGFAHSIHTIRPDVHPNSQLVLPATPITNA
jgi:hypothetical protein